MKIGIPKEVHDGERRVATTPEVAGQLINKLGFEVAIQSGAGASANFADSAYAEAGVTVVKNAKAIWDDSDIILKVRAPEFNPDLKSEEVDLLHENQILITLWRWIAFPVFPGRKKWMHSAPWPTLPDTAPWSKPPSTLAGSLPVRLPPRVKFHRLK
jgi:hypothetical protein